MSGAKTIIVLAVIAILSLCTWVVIDKKNEPEQRSIVNGEHISERIERENRITRAEQEKNSEREAQRERVYFFGGIFASFIIAGLFPRFGMYILGPGILIATASFIFGEKGVGGFLFSSGGDGWVGLGKLIVGIIILLAFSFGVAIIAVSRASLRAREGDDYAD